MTHCYLAITRDGSAGTEVLLALRNLYLPPHGSHQVVRIASHAAQYVLPGGRAHDGEQPRGTAIRYAEETLGLTLAAPNLKPLSEQDGVATSFRVTCQDLDAETLCERLSAGTLGSQLYQSVVWAPVDQASCLLGVREEIQQQAWVAAQLMRALEAGFSEAYLNSQANQPHQVFSVALASLVLQDAGRGSSATSPS